jgi:hypothetical protein
MSDTTSRPPHQTVKVKTAVEEERVEEYRYWWDQHTKSMKIEGWIPLPALKGLVEALERMTTPVETLSPAVEFCPVCGEVGGMCPEWGGE